ncbi:Metastasis-associated protein MTA1 [Liparis tanakae]|uniref:Metastasis-associated protein MTA1 n=1 Tax=Liparis tanakae TaxID=230148 RepID=A0A4Z2I0P8_9TELE|nr:Metastasis-associated protein MTA1 [Liparis tanakae]
MSAWAVSIRPSWFFLAELCQLQFGEGCNASMGVGCTLSLLLLRSVVPGHCREIGSQEEEEEEREKDRGVEVLVKDARPGGQLELEAGGAVHAAAVSPSPPAAANNLDSEVVAAFHPTSKFPLGQIDHYSALHMLFTASPPPSLLPSPPPSLASSPASRGKCCVTLLNETEALKSYLEREDSFFYSLVYDPQQKTLLADKGEIRVGNKYQADITDLMKEDEEDGRDLEKLEEKIFDPSSSLTEKQIDQFLVVAR